MKLVFTETAWNDYLWFQENDRRLLKRINTLIKATLRTPSEGIGKPERLKANLSGYWSRRINEEHRLVYEVTESELVIIACRFHYQK
ncbi:MAG TPA: Txe/YoeB family addiction module toxin [Anaerolineae bacterium]|nr:Txe/YoeB family addiction module toxin [Anaerolineae bacterium]MCB0177234.1 Txe/YoeB family addiction module toxin [Anaerolineae bacterium]MCB0225556.1 Txe/YoeB family addiction module toxin [Anaerolineae bacterium]MCB9103797.1 Txe/YoeB family addiction module toxin [Anaerolineales bacterium]HRV96384.1 Txe/YoeB family addiction module toxin [Anaerolineae bacterium]